MLGLVTIVEGGQYGSEGKGQVCAVIAKQRNVTMAVRTGSINAGHTVFFEGQPVSMQIIPTAWVIPGVKLVLGAGCYIHPEVLRHEVEVINGLMGGDVRSRLYIDSRCAWFGEQEHVRAVHADRHHAMGATGKGCSEAIISKMNDRGINQPKSRLFQFSPYAKDYNFVDTVRVINDEYDRGGHILLEGTQGALLDFNLGPYPFVTSRMTTPSAWMAECGLSPTCRTNTISVFRTFPIRVAGNSGPLPGEISWPILAREVNQKLVSCGKPEMVDEGAIREFEDALTDTIAKEWPEVDDWFHSRGRKATEFHEWTPDEREMFRVALSDANAHTLKSLSAETLSKISFFEKTTVTKKLRRVARFDKIDATRSMTICRPNEVVLTFMNYKAPDVWGVTTTDELKQSSLFNKALEELRFHLRVPVSFVTTGPLPEHMIKLHE